MREEDKKTNQEPESANAQKVLDTQAKQIHSLEESTNRLLEEASFFSNKIDAQSKTFATEAANLLSKSETTLEESIKLLDEYKKQVKLTKQELIGFTLIPDKIQGQINAMMPQISKEIGGLYVDRMENISSTLSGMKQDLNDHVADIQEKLENTSDQCVKNIKEAHLELVQDGSIQSIAEDFKSTQQAIQTLDESRSKRYFFRLLGSLFLSIAVAAGSTYLVLKYYPTHVQLNYNDKIIVHTSDITVWGGKDIEIKDKRK